MSDAAKCILLLAEIFTVLSAVLVAFHPNILYATVFLLFSFLGVAGLFLFAGADFVAGVQVVVYVGGVTILILFAIMLTRALYAAKFQEIKTKVGISIGVLLLAVVPFLWKALEQVLKIAGDHPPFNEEVFAMAPKTESIGNALLTQYLLPFEAITILLLGSLVGAVYLARSK